MSSNDNSHPEEHEEGHEHRSFADRLKHPFPEFREKLKGTSLLKFPRTSC